MLSQTQPTLNETSLNEPSASTINQINTNDANENNDLAFLDEKSHFRGRIRMVSEFVNFKERSQRKMKGSNSRSKSKSAANGSINTAQPLENRT